MMVGNCWLDWDVHSLVGGAAELLGAEARQEAPGDGFQQGLHLYLQPHLNELLILQRLRVRLERPLQAEERHSRHAGFLLGFVRESELIHDIWGEPGDCMK